MTKRNTEPRTYTTSRGVTVEFLPLSPFEVQEIHGLVPEPIVPTRTIETAVEGYSEVEELAADDLRTDEERRRWKAYAKARSEAEDARRKLTLKYIFVEGLRFETGDMEAWKAKRRRWNLDVPDDEVELLATYAQTEIVGSAEDIEKITEGVISRKGVDEATLKSVQSTFQRTVQREAPGRPGNEGREVDVQPAHGRDEGGEGVGAGAADEVL